MGVDGKLFLPAGGNSVSRLVAIASKDATHESDFKIDKIVESHYLTLFMGSSRGGFSVLILDTRAFGWKF